jgi:hypothetical protein
MARTSLPSQYSHRNGETEPPAIHGWYWLKKFHILPITNAIVFVAHKKYKKELLIMNGASDKPEIPVRDVIGRWWGPIMPPWKQNE